MLSFGLQLTFRARRVVFLALYLNGGRLETGIAFAIAIVLQLFPPTAVGLTLCHIGTWS